MENYDLKTYSGVVTNHTADLEIGAVPAGMKRYFTYLKINNILAAETLELYESAVAVGADGTGADVRKDFQTLAAGDTIMYPDTPDAEKPIMSFAAGTFVTMMCHTVTASFDVTFQYYDAP